MNEFQNLSIFLQKHNISMNLANKIYGYYKEESLNIVKRNPYQLCMDIKGIGFKTADMIAIRLGVSYSSPRRVEAFIYYLLGNENFKEGHVFSHQNIIEIATSTQLKIDKEKVKEAIAKLHEEGRIIIEQTSTGTAIYLLSSYRAENTVAEKICKLVKSPSSVIPDIDNCIVGVEGELSEKEGTQFYFSAEQRDAIQRSLGKKIAVITGGPGTGKTTIIRAIIDICEHNKNTVLLATFTGKAAKRLFDVTEKEAKTIHRTLEYSPSRGRFMRDESNPLEGDTLIVDEFSTVDLFLMLKLMKAMPRGMSLILVGDKDQLPSIGPGNLLHDIIESKRVEVCKLTEIFRQKKGSLIAENAHRINQGETNLILPENNDSDQSFYFFSIDDERKVLESIMHIYKAFEDAQVLSPMYRGLCGVDNLNKEIQRQFNPNSESLVIGGKEFRVKDRVMQLRNDYAKNIFNGNIGTIRLVSKENQEIGVDFDGEIISYNKNDIKDLTLAYAITIHKSQGSEYPVTIIPILTQHWRMLQRKILYTAESRAQELCFIVGSEIALCRAIKNNQIDYRNTYLKERIIKILG